jgi:enterobactin synthetase component D
MIESRTSINSGLVKHRDVFWIDCPHMGYVPICRIAFDATSFRDSDFCHYGISMPVSLSNAVPKRRAEFLAGRIAAGGALALIGQSATNIPIGDMRAPVWPPGVVGSISHSDHFAIGAALPASEHRGLGIDIERVVSEEIADSLSGSVVTTREKLIFSAAAPELTRSQILTIAFSAKESIFKAISLHLGYYIDFNSVEIYELDKYRGIIFIKTLNRLSPLIPSDYRFTVKFILQSEHVVTFVLW